jgi:hypothetical protein
MNKKLVAAVASKQKEVGMDKRCKGKGVPMRIGMVMGVLIALILMMSAGVARAAFEVKNLAVLEYYSNVAMSFRYTATDTADIRVMYGPQMYLAKSVRNEVTGNSSTDMVLCGRGDTITFVLTAANNVSGADTGAWWVYVTDTFALFQMVSGESASVGPAGTDSFVYVPASETSMNSAGFDGFVQPNSIAYYTGATAPNWNNGTWSAFQTYVGRVEPAGIQGIKWMWRYVPSQLDPYGAQTNLPYNIRVSFQIKKNDN